MSTQPLTPAQSAADKIATELRQRAEPFDSMALRSFIEDVVETEYAELHATVVKLPKCWRLTADGRLVQDWPVVPEMTLWRKWPNTAPECEAVREHRVKAICVDGAYLYCVAHWDGYQETPIPWKELFDTREAAEAKGDKT